MTKLRVLSASVVKENSVFSVCSVVIKIRCRQSLKRLFARGDAGSINFLICARYLAAVSF